MSRLVLIPLLGTALLGCGSTSLPSPEAGWKDGKGAVICLDREMAVWVTIRATAPKRTKGWGDAAAALVFYPSRGINPVFLPDGRSASVIWIDGRIVAGIQAQAKAQGGGGYVHHGSEVTAAVVLPAGTDLKGLKEGDRLTILGER